MARLAERSEATTTAIEAAAHLLLGACGEAALNCASAENPRKTARAYAAALRRMIAGLVLA